MNVLIIDDEYYAIVALAQELEKIKSVNVIGAFQDVNKAIKQIANLKPDIIFMDIHLKSNNGIDYYNQIMEINSDLNVIFVTAYDEYAVKAFELDVVDYLLKPVTAERLKIAVSRVTKKVDYSDGKKPLFIKCFKTIECIIDGKSTAIKWRTKKAEELLAYLIMAKGDFVSKEKIAEVLWPGKKRDNALSNLYIAYHYITSLEKQYHIDFSLESVRGKMRIDYDAIDCDLKIFEEGISALERNDLELIKKAVEVYRGGLYEEQYYSWGEENRQYYEVGYEKMLNKLQ